MVDNSQGEQVAHATGGESNPPSGFFVAFEDRVGAHQFQHNAPGWGYLAQLHEWASKEHKPLEWVVNRVGGNAHQPEFEAYPKCGLQRHRLCMSGVDHLLFVLTGNGQDLTAYIRRGPSKKKAKDASAEAMAKSGCCVSPHNHDALMSRLF